MPITAERDIIMRWERIRSGKLAEAIELSKGVCYLHMGCIEHHGKHLPLGQDVLAGKIVELAAEKEPIVMFPDMYFGEKTGAGEFQGTVIFSNKLIFDILTETCDEIGRNGFKKIVIGAGHGGNLSMINNFVRSTLYKKKNYMVMSVRGSSVWPRPKDMLEIIDGGNRDYFPELTDEDIALLRDVDENNKVYGHGCFIETAVALGLHPELVDKSMIGPIDGNNVHRLDDFQLKSGVYTPYGWMANYPNSLSSDYNAGNERIGRSVVKYAVDKMAEKLKLIKEDTTMDDYHKEWYAKQELIEQGRWDLLQ